jgi:hypothetical protein
MFQWRKFDLGRYLGFLIVLIGLQFTVIYGASNFHLLSPSTGPSGAWITVATLNPPLIAIAFLGANGAQRPLWLELALFFAAPLWVLFAASFLARVVP